MLDDNENRPGWEGGAKAQPPLSGGAITALVVGLLSPLFLASVVLFSFSLTRQSSELYFGLWLAVTILGLLSGLFAQWPIAAGKRRGRWVALAGSGLCLLTLALYGSFVVAAVAMN